MLLMPFYTQKTKFMYIIVSLDLSIQYTCRYKQCEDFDLLNFTNCIELDCHLNTIQSCRLLCNIAIPVMVFVVEDSQFHTSKTSFCLKGG